MRGVADGVQGGERKQEVARGSRRWPRPLGRGPHLASAYWQRKTTGGGVEMGWAVLGQVSGRQVTSFSLSLLFLFYFCYFVFDLI